MLLQIKERHWKKLEPLRTSAEIVTHLRDQGLPQAATAIQTSLNALAAQRPAALDANLEATAVKQGLIEAYYGFFPRPEPR